MRWARQQDGIEFVTRKTSYRGEDVAHDVIWRIPGKAHVSAQRLVGPTGLGRVDVSAEGEHAAAEIGDQATADQVLRVLAALDLIPAEYAEQRDERYGRCEKCGELCRWATGHDFWPDRWVHIHGDAWLSRIDGHRAEVAE